jgi:hypothetical protein
MKQVMHIKALNPDQQNRRKHTPRNVAMIVKSLNDVGGARSIVIDEDDNILAGNATIEAAAEVGIEKLEVVEGDGHTIIAVRRRGLTPDQKRALAIYDNRSAELAEWDIDQLKEDQANGEDLNSFFYDDELEKIFVAVDGGGDSKGGGDQQLDGFQYRVIIDCQDEIHQAELLKKFDAEGLKCRPLIS